MENEKKDILDQFIYQQDEVLTNRTSNVLKEACIYTFRDLTSMTSKQLIEYRNCGRKTLREIRNYLKKFDLHLKDDILLYEEEYKKIFMSIPNAIMILQTEIECAIKKLKNMSYDLDHVLTSINKD